jgi:hypothetical protein
MEGNVAKAIAKICQDVGLPSGDAYTQDWAYELPEKFRTREFFKKYVLAYSTPGYGPDEKQVLMELLLDVANDLLDRNEGLEDDLWEKVRAHLTADRESHRDLIEKWSRVEEPLEDAFPLTPRMRAVREELVGQ